MVLTKRQTSDLKLIASRYPGAYPIHMIGHGAIHATSLRSLQRLGLVGPAYCEGATFVVSASTAGWEMAQEMPS